MDLLLLGVQAFAIHAYCKLCILTYLLSAAALLALLPARRAARGAGGRLRAPEGRWSPSRAWALGTAAVAGAVLAANVALAARAARRQATLLGAPAPGGRRRRRRGGAARRHPGPGRARRSGRRLPRRRPRGSPRRRAPGTGTRSTGGSGPRSSRRRSTTRRKLEAYFSEKAQREYETSAPVALDVANAPMRGPATAPVAVVEYSDFMCPFCRNLGMALSQFVPQAGGRVKVFFKNYPLDNTCNPKLPRTVHSGACNLALGGICANYQGKFDAYHDRVFSTELQNPQASDVVRLAGEAGLNAVALQGCLSDPKTKAELTAQIEEGNRLGVNSTPTVYVNGKKLPRINDFVAVVDKEARKKGFPPLAP